MKKRKPGKIPNPLLSIFDFSPAPPPPPPPKQSRPKAAKAVTVYLDETVIDDLKEVAARKRYSTRKRKPVPENFAYRELAKDLIIRGLKNYWLSQEMYIGISEIRSRERKSRYKNS